MKRFDEEAGFTAQVPLEKYFRFFQIKLSHFQV